VAAKLDAPVLGAQELPGTHRWQFSMGWRFQTSDRHFVGMDLDNERDAEGSQVINRLNLFDIGLQYAFGPRWSLSAALPFQVVNRSNPLRDETDAVVGRTVTEGDGMGDLVVSARRWMLDPSKHPRGNVRLGFGVKAPTGKDDVLDTRLRFVDPDGDGPEEPVLAFSDEYSDQSIQPGDGGWGFVVDFQSFKRFTDSTAFYGSATYLMNPKRDNGVIRGILDPDIGNVGTTVNATTDQYLARAGVQWTPGVLNDRLGLSLGGRMEGVPWKDLLGPDDEGTEQPYAFRRPGYAISVEPGVSWTAGVHTVSLHVPFAIQRNRLQNARDRVTGNHGDAAFADYVVLLGYWRRF
jgi:hypothetical protein